jgi:transposase
MNQPQIPSSAPLEVARHYQRLLGLPAPWMVTGLVENIAEARIDIQLHHTPNAKFPCPHCQALCPVRDHAPARRWRHLDALQYATFLTARSPRVKCEKHGVCGVSLPWADFSARWTIDLECKAIDTMHACASLSAAAKLLNLSWDMLQSIMSSAVERGLERRSLHGLCLLGLDEKSFLRGQSYISVCNDLVGRRVLEVSPGAPQKKPPWPCVSCLKRSAGRSKRWPST